MLSLLTKLLNYVWPVVFIVAGGWFVVTGIELYQVSHGFVDVLVQLLRVLFGIILFAASLIFAMLAWGDRR